MSSNLKKIAMGPPLVAANSISLLQVGLSDAFCKNTGHFDLSSVPDLSCVVVRKRHGENRETISIVKPQLLICPYFGWVITFRCVCDGTIAPRIASTAPNKLCWKNCPDKIPCQSQYNLRNSVLFLFEVTANYLFSKYQLQALIFKIPVSAKLAIKYRPGPWNTGHLATLPARCCKPKKIGKHWLKLSVKKDTGKKKHPPIRKQ